MSKQPPEITPARTDTQRLADDITKAMTALTHDWPHMIRPGETQAPGMASRSGVLLDDHDQRDADQNRITRVLSLRRFAQDQLASWCRLIIEDRGISNGATVPSSTDVPGMATFIARHADWLSGHEDGPLALSELRPLSIAVTRFGPPPISDKPLPAKPFLIGTCNLEHEFHPDRGPEECGGRVYAHPDLTADLTITEQRAKKLPTCHRCGSEADVEWWYRHMFGGAAGVSHLVTADELIGVIAVRLDWIVTHGQIRQWKHRTKIESAGKDSKGRTLYRHDAVIEAIRDDVKIQKEKVRR